MKFPELYRASRVPSMYRSKEGDPFGLFQIPGREACGRVLRVMACDGEETGWDHVSVSLEDSRKCPSWDEMSAVKALFFDDEETVIQFHPPKSDHVNFHPGCLHLWHWTQGEIPRPPSILVGPKLETA